jgi:hypothetical protein
MKVNFKRYVDQITQNLENLNQDQSYRLVKIEKSRRVIEATSCMDIYIMYLYMYNVYVGQLGS